MAFQSRDRDPLLDSETALTLERRGRELMGLVLIGLGLLVGAMIATYSPDDPSILSPTNAPVTNLTGPIGASIAAPLYMIIGRASWALALVPLVWGLRMVLHRAEGGVMGRLIFAPIWIAVCAIYASGVTAGPAWSHGFGLGGLFGDMMMGSILTALPLTAAVGLKVTQLVFALVLLALGAFVLGFDRRELYALRVLAVGGLGLALSGGLKLAGKGAAEAWSGARQMRARRAAADTAATAQPMPFAPDPQAYDPAQPMGYPGASDDDAAYPAPHDLARQGYAGDPSPVYADPAPYTDPAYAVPDPQAYAPEPAQAPRQSGISARIADAVRARRRAGPVASDDIAVAKPLTRGRGHGPQPLIVQPKPALPDEPVLQEHIGQPKRRAAPVDGRPPAEHLPDPAAADQGAPAVTARAGSLVPPPPPFEPLPSEWADPVPDPDPVFRHAEVDLDEAQILDEAMPAPEMPEPLAAPVARKVVKQPARKAVKPSRRAQQEAQPSLRFDEPENSHFELPPLNLLMSPRKIERQVLSDEALEENARMLETVLDDYGVKGEIVSVRPGPVVTMYELEPAPGLKASRVIGLADDIARSMSALSARVSTVPGRSVIGIELPNDNREMVCLREILASRDYGDGKHALPLALGKDIGGDSMVANLAKMPHLLIAGTTGSGKSVAINTMILSLLYKLTPDECRLIMIDPKMLELSVYDGIPHLLSPVVTDPKKAVVALKWVVGEMEDRYRKMSKMGVRNIDGYNSRVADALSRGEMFSRTVQTGFDDETGEPVFETEEFAPERMPYIVVIVDEMADLMMVAGKEIEACIQRLAQMARASGIHLIMATQRPSVDVITGTIKANFPTRISFQVTSKIDSRTILGEMGAEQLLGMGDMLYMAGGAKITRCHGPFVSDEEVEEIVNHLKSFGPPVYVGGVVEGPADEKADGIDAVLGLNTGGNTNGEDALYDQAVAIVLKDRKCSTSYVQRKLGIGYNKAARLVEQMEDEGVVSPANHVGKREILVPES